MWKLDVRSECITVRWGCELRWCWWKVTKKKKKETSCSMCGEGRTHHILLFETRALILTRTRVYTVYYKVWVHFRSSFVFFFSALIASIQLQHRHPARHTAGTTSCLFSTKTNDSLLFIYSLLHDPRQERLNSGGKYTRCQSVTVKTRQCVVFCKVIRLIGLQQDVLTWFDLPKCTELSPQDRLIRCLHMYKIKGRIVMGRKISDKFLGTFH